MTGGDINPLCVYKLVLFFGLFFICAAPLSLSFRERERERTSPERCKLRWVWDLFLWPVHHPVISVLPLQIPLFVTNSQWPFETTVCFNSRFFSISCCWSLVAQTDRHTHNAHTCTLVWLVKGKQSHCTDQSSLGFLENVWAMPWNSSSFRRGQASMDSCVHVLICV